MAANRTNTPGAVLTKQHQFRIAFPVFMLMTAHRNSMAGVLPLNAGEGQC
jgi:hypothetical protein